ncbi:unnamed protein product [Rotaria magnacalcarata]|uniref:ATP-binding cassette sub-family G member 2 n=2 Tax=Rotaria magnacalcarata TaxID=392030 RepID=A0A820EAQ4_9BILA|nr:unnamed protein product [Rotaria magnacalcarata]
MELVLSPRILFLDEPTTGLDSSMARSVMECLQKLSRTGRTIVFSIHQPRYSIFKLFDSLYLLAAGRCIYHGPADGVLSFFSSVGFPCEEHNNPADFIIDVAQGDRLPLSTRHPDDMDVDTLESPIALHLYQEYMKTSIYKSIQAQLPEKISLSDENDINDLRITKKSRLHDMYYVSQRTLRNSYRNPSLSILQVVISIVLGTLVGLIYLNIANTTGVGVKNRVGGVFFIIANQVFLNLSALELFIKERVLFAHENASGYYHVITYFLAKIICDIIPLRTIPSLTFSIVVYFMMGLQRTAAKFFIFFFFIWLTTICSSALCFLVSASVRNFGVADLIAALFCGLTLLFSGLLVEVSSVVVFLQWIQYISIFAYGTNALLINEFTGLTLCYSNSTNLCTKSGSDVLTDLDITHGTDWDLWKNAVALIAIIVGFLILTYVQLRRMNAIMGPTGCGKSSLLDLLADRKDRQGFEGEILLNGQIRTHNYKSHVGYVVQDDIVCGNLTVKENLMFSANVRLSTEYSTIEKSLDSSMARSVMECLHHLSRTGCTIVFSIHQPRYSIFKLFDTLFSLSAGRCTYHGPTDSVLNFFSSVGFSCEEHNNPAEFLLDVTQGDRQQPSTQQQNNIAFNEEHS